MDTQAQGQKAEFNMAFSYLNLVNGLFYIADDARLKADFHAWCHALMTLKCELGVWMKKPLYEAITSDLFAIDDAINTAISRSRTTHRIEIDKGIHVKLDKIQYELRLVTKDANMLMKMADDAMNALE